ncbi:unnamed protein product [Protopolystoma xenopodis]|uniref:Phosphatidic acid phosphatase type 2/haloperoxidase domain-containing protein n=1 Tax=Protopolystoma xenopodis TaxID=117903 RepID=A0A448WUV6_9PLAT|nr:unnamed protein product [Protopolystoma xenopodis]
MLQWLLPCIVLPHFLIGRQPEPGIMLSIKHLASPNSEKQQLMELVNWSLFFGLSIWAFLITISRVIMSRHYLTDVIAGYLIGLVEAGFLIFGMNWGTLTDEVTVWLTSYLAWPIKPN